MKIALKNNLQKEIVVYGVYSGVSQQKPQRLYYVIEDSDDDAGFTAVAEDQCEVIDNSLDYFILRKDGRDMDILIHKAAYTSESFFDSLVNHEDGNEAVQELLQNMNDLGLNP